MVKYFLQETYSSRHGIELRQLQVSKMKNGICTSWNKSPTVSLGQFQPYQSL
jgi:hypothetical protein